MARVLPSILLLALSVRGALLIGIVATTVLAIIVNGWGGWKVWPLPGVAVIPTPGHTVGHQSVLVTDGDDEVIVTGDVLVHAVQLANPDVAYRSESDPSVAADTRRRLLADARTRGALIATAHLHRGFVVV